MPKVALVTGGSRGIGKAIVKRLAGENHKVFFTYSSDERSAHVLAEELSAKGKVAICHHLDIRHPEKVGELIQEIINSEGNLDILVNNAGITKDGLMMRMSEGDFSEVVNTNLMGTFNCIKAVSRQMIKQQSGVIVNISSVIGLIGNAGQSNYAASKAGIIALTKSAAKELGSRGVRVVAVAPGFIETDMTNSLDEGYKEMLMQGIALKRFGKPEDVAELVEFLSSDRAAFITGQTFVVDGGMI